MCEDSLVVIEEDLESEGDKHTESHAGCVEDPLRHHKAHGEEEVRGRDKGQHHQGQGLGNIQVHNRPGVYKGEINSPYNVIGEKSYS